MNVGFVGNRTVTGLPVCHCGRPVAVRWAERQLEDDHPDTEELVDAARIEAWVVCVACGWVSDMDARCWSGGVFDDEEVLTQTHIDEAVAGCCEAWREQRTEETEAAETTGGE